MFGTSKVVITMTDLSRQEAGVMKLNKEMLIIVQPVNDAPRFDLLRVLISGPVNTQRQRIPVATKISWGPANELCEQAGSWGRQYQRASFVVEDMSHPFLFAEFPSIDERSGDLVFRVAADTSGVGVKQTVCKRGHECKEASSWPGYNDTGMSREQFVNKNRTNAMFGMQGWPDERSVSFVERRAHKEDRIRFRGMGSKEPLKFDQVSQAVYTPDMICHIEPFDNMPHGQGSETLQLLGMAGGCQDTALDHVLEANETHNYVTPTPQLQVLGRWDFFVGKSLWRSLCRSRGT